MAILFAVSSTHAVALDEPTNRQLIASMPDEVESVLVLQAEPLLKNDGPFKREFQNFFGTSEQTTSGEPPSMQSDLVTSRDENNLDRIVFAELIKLEPKKRLLGGAAFETPQGIGAGSFRHWSIWVTKKSNNAVKQKIENRDGLDGKIEKTASEGIDIYSSSIELFKSKSGDAPRVDKVFVAFPNEHLAIIAFSRDDVKHIARSLASKVETIPPRWKTAAASTDLELPIVLLRKFPQAEQQFLKRDFENPAHVQFLKVPIDSFSLTSEAKSNVKFKLRVITKSPSDAEFYFYGGSFTGGFPPPYWKWTKKTDTDGFTTDLEEAKGPLRLSYPIVLTLVGIQMAI